jgi:dTMP kinase
MLIVFEGIDGSGQTTQSKLLADYLISKNYKVFLTKEPTNNEIGKLIRKILNKEIEFDNLGLQLLMMADRAYHMKEIRNYLKNNYIVICDRFWFSTVAYGSEDEKMFKILFKINSILFGFPDFLIILDVDPEIALKRKDAKEIFENVEKLKKVRENYSKIAKIAKKYTNVFLIDSNKPIEEVQKEIREKLNL